MRGRNLIILFKRYCLLYLSVPLIQQELDEFVDYWNSHLIRKNKQCLVSSCVPNELHEMPEFYGKAMLAWVHCVSGIQLTGAVDQLKPFDVSLWMFAYQTESESPLPFVPIEFEGWADELLQTHNFFRDDIGAPKIHDLYIYLSQQEPPFWSCLKCYRVSSYS